MDERKWSLKEIESFLPYVAEELKEYEFSEQASRFALLGAAMLINECHRDAQMRHLLWLRSGSPAVAS